MKSVSAKTLALCGLFAALCAVGAFLRIPVPYVPFTLQTMFVAMAGLLLGPKLGAASAGAYVLLGLLGLPIFTQGGGPAYVLQPTFGYLIGFILSAWLVGFLGRRAETLGKLYAAALWGLLPVYGLGLIYLYCVMAFYLQTPMELGNLLVTGFLLTLPGDVITLLLSALLCARLRPALRRMGLLPSAV